jgi:hypothetical protein
MLGFTFFSDLNGNIRVSGMGFDPFNTDASVFSYHGSVHD